MPLDTFLFDLNGTLIDSIDLILRSYRHTMWIHRANEPLPPDDVWMKRLSTPLRVDFRHWTEDAAEIHAMVATCRGDKFSQHDTLAKHHTKRGGATLATYSPSIRREVWSPAIPWTSKTTMTEGMH